ncbi:Cyclin-like [Phytophthora cactorum]|nr:Cyclin-like [Phytophthora cactorum]
MGMNFWHSTHYLYWMKDVTKGDLRKRNPQDRRHLTDEEIDSIHLANISLRQIIIYTAIIFYRRFYQTQSFVNFDPHLVVGTVFFLASKAETSYCSMFHVKRSLTRVLCFDVAGVDEDESMYTFQDKDILECEFYVIEALQFDLILHHPFPSLLQQLVQYSYRTDIIFLYPPFMVAYAAVYISCRDAGYDAAQVFATVNIKKDLMLKIVGEFQEAVEDEKRLFALQVTALEKLEEIIPDASAAEAEAALSAPAEK